MVDISLFPTAGQLQRRADEKLDSILSNLVPLTWERVSKALEGLEWHAHATFENEGYDSSEYGDYIISIPDSMMGFRTYAGGIEPGPVHIRWDDSEVA